MVDTWPLAGSCGRVIKDFRPDAIVSVYPLRVTVLGRMAPQEVAPGFLSHDLTDFRRALVVGCNRKASTPSRSQRDLRPRARSRAAAARRVRAAAPSSASRIRVEKTTTTRCADARLDPDDRAGPAWSQARGLRGRRSTTVERSARERVSPPHHRVWNTTEAPAPALQATVVFGTVSGWTDQMPALETASDAPRRERGVLTCMEAFAAGLP